MIEFFNSKLFGILRNIPYICKYKIKDMPNTTIEQIQEDFQFIDDQQYSTFNQMVEDFLFNQLIEEINS